MAKILIVDDSALSRRMLRRILEEAGHTVVEASDGMIALEQYFVENPNLVFLDLTMQGMHGLDVLSQLRLLDPTVKVVVASADIQQSTQAMVHERGGAAFLEKPFVATRIAAVVERLLSEETSRDPE